MELDQLLQPVRDAREAAASQRDALREQMRALDADITAMDKVLKAAGLGTNGARPVQEKKKKKQAPPSPDAQRRVLDFVAKNVTVDAKTTAEALGLSTSYASRTLSYLRDMEQIRLVRIDPAMANGKGHKPVYGPWLEGER